MDADLKVVFPTHTVHGKFKCMYNNTVDQRQSNEKTFMTKQDRNIKIYYLYWIYHRNLWIKRNATLFKAIFRILSFRLISTTLWLVFDQCISTAMWLVFDLYPQPGGLYSTHIHNPVACIRPISTTRWLVFDLYPQPGGLYSTYILIINFEW